MYYFWVVLKATNLIDKLTELCYHLSIVSVT
jgi:hypothetical protein